MRLLSTCLYRVHNCANKAHRCQEGLIYTEYGEIEWRNGRAGKGHGVCYCVAFEWAPAGPGFGGCCLGGDGGWGGPRFTE